MDLESTLVSLGRLEISPETRAFCNIRSILLRNLELNGNHLMDCHFTIHTDEETEEVLLISDTVYQTRVGRFMNRYIV